MLVGIVASTGKEQYTKAIERSVGPCSSGCYIAFGWFRCVPADMLADNQLADLSRELVDDSQS